jgi:large subunit ribosomal protein L2
MIMKKLKPITPGSRFVVRPDYAELTSSTPYKPLLEKHVSGGGRNNQGRITVRHKGGGAKQHYRLVDFKRDNYDVPGTVETLEYDPMRSAFIALVVYADGQRRYIIAPKTLQVGDPVISSEHVPMQVGNAMPIGNILLGTRVHCVELKVGKGGQLARSAGTSVSIVNREGAEYTSVKLTSGETRKIFNRCRATIGSVSNPDHKLRSLGKAGAKRWRGIRPTVRGTAMNPVDHPHGGGEGKTRGKIPMTPWGKPTKGKKTRNNKRTDKFIQKRQSTRK